MIEGQRQLNLLLEFILTFVTQFILPLIRVMSVIQDFFMNIKYFH